MSKGITLSEGIESRDSISSTFIAAVSTWHVHDDEDDKVITGVHIIYKCFDYISPVDQITELV